MKKKKIWTKPTVKKLELTPEQKDKLAREARINATRENTPPYIPPEKRNQSGYVEE